MKKVTKKRIIIISLVLLTLSIIFLGLDSKTPAHIFIDEELGVITTTQNNLVTQAIFKNTAGSGITVSNVGERVQICDYFAKVSNYKYTQYLWTTQLNGNTITSQDMTYYANSKTSYCKSWTPTTAGKYEVNSIYTLCPDIIGPIRPSDCIQRSSRDTKAYYLEVKSSEQACNKKPYTGEWYISSNILNGNILKAKVYKVTNDCQYSVNYELVQTQCNDGFLIEGSNLKSTSNDGWKCVPAITDNIEQDENANNIVDEYENRDPECNTDLVITCGDGSQLVSKVCFDGLFFDSGSQCAVIGEPEEDFDTPNNIENQSDTPDNSIPDNSNNESSDQNFKSFYFLIPLTFILLVALIVWMKLKKPKRRK